MPLDPEEIELLLCCPDDGATMAAQASGFRCQKCHRFYPWLARNILELLPSEPIALPERSELARYREGYRHEFSRPREIRENAKAWGAAEDLSRQCVRLRERQAREVLQFLRGKQNESEWIFCDLSGGAGYCTLNAAAKYRLVFHCDLSFDALAYASAKANASHLENIIFVHADYFQPPFRSSIHHLACLDTLIRGPWHEKRLLQSIQAVLAAGGAAVVDFHNWWHNPLRRLGLLPDNFLGNKSYTRRELRKLLANSGIGQFETMPFVQEVDLLGARGSVFAQFIPPTRLMVKLAGVSAPLLQTCAARKQEGRA
jgi:ubiquinone/menaquinone biosynthesis C-methylase UbiE